MAGTWLARVGLQGLAAKGLEGQGRERQVQGKANKTIKVYCKGVAHKGEEGKKRQVRARRGEAM